MRKSHHRKPHGVASACSAATRHIEDPLGLSAATAARDVTCPGRSTEPDRRASVNPLWMITAGLAAFLILLVAVW